MIIRTIKCSVKDCTNEHTEAKPNKGFPGWCHIVGLVDPETGEENPQFCPEHKTIILHLLNGTLGELMS